MDKEKLADDARVATSSFILAGWRSAAILDVQDAFKNILEAYAGNDIAQSKLLIMSVEFNNWAHGRVDKLREIERNEQAKAARLTALLSEGE